MGTFILFILQILFASSGLCAFSFSSQADPNLTSIFYPQEKGWLGADVSASIRLVNESYVWLFGDTMYGELKEKHHSYERKVTAFPHSSLAFMDMAESEEPSFYFQLKGKSIDSMGIFTPQNPTNSDEFYWPVAGIISPNYGHLIVLTQTVIATKTGIGFQLIGTDAVLVTNPLDPPAKWQYTTSRIPSSSTSLSWNTGIALIGEEFYIVGLGQAPDYNEQAFLAKISEYDLVTFNWTGIQYYVGGNTWSNNTTNLFTIFSSIYSEGTLMYNSFMQQWYMILSQVYGPIMIAYAQNVTGPWTLDVLYEIPELYSNSTFFTYAAKSHPEFAVDNNELVVTYNINSNLAEVAKDLNIYHPHFVRVYISQS